ncbi:MAG: glycosyltransferase [Actinomycetes bacterium]
MHILQIANFITETSGGMKQCLSALQKRYLQLGHEVTLIMPCNKNSQGIENGVNVIRLHGVPLVGSGGYRVILRRSPLAALIQELQPDVVEVSDKTTLSWIPQYLRSLHIPCVVISHERTDLAMKRNTPGWLPSAPFLKSWQTSLSFGAPVIVCASQFAAKEFDGRGMDVRFVPLGVDTKTFCPQQRQGNSAHIKLVYCGRFAPEKEPFLAVEALRELVIRGIEAKLTMVGSGPLEAELRNCAVGLPIEFVGQISSRSEVAALLSQADVGISMGGVETFGLSILETLACGTPVVVSKEGAASEFVNSGIGRVVNQNAVDIANAVVEIVSNESLTEVRENCADLASRYTWDKTAGMMLDIYSDLLENVGISQVAS